MKEYYLVYADSPLELENKVNIRLSEGWELHGNMDFRIGERYDSFYQAMIREKESTPKKYKYFEVNKYYINADSSSVLHILGSPQNTRFGKYLLAEKINAQGKLDFIPIGNFELIKDNDWIEIDKNYWEIIVKSRGLDFN